MTENSELVERLRRGDRDALERIYGKYKDDLLSVATFLLANRTEAEDCLHDVFVSLAARSAHVRPDGNLKGYLITAIANRSRDRLRGRKRSHQATEAASTTQRKNVGTVGDPTAATIQREETERLYEAIMALPADQRTVITLRLHGEMTFEEIAQQEGVSNNTIRSRYRYGLDKLRSSLRTGATR